MVRICGLSDTSPLGLIEMCFNPSNGSSFLTVQCETDTVCILHLQGILFSTYSLHPAVLFRHPIVLLIFCLPDPSVSVRHGSKSLTVSKFDISLPSSVNFHLMHFLPGELNLVSISNDSLHF